MSIQSELAQMWQELLARPDGPMAFRFYLQPLMAIFFALRDGRRDARGQRPAYLWALAKERDHQRRRELLRDGWRSVGKIFLLALVLDLVYDLIVFKALRPVQSLLIATLLALLPYVLLRGPVNRIAQRMRARRTDTVARDDRDQQTRRAA